MMFDAASYLACVLAQVLQPTAPWHPTPPEPQFEPTFERPRVVREQGPSPTFYRLEPRLVYGLVRTQLGVHVRVAPTSVAAFTFDQLGGVIARAGRGSRAALLAEGGYHYVGFGSHFAVAGAGLLIDAGPEQSDASQRSTRDRLRFGVIVDGLAGINESQSALGLRASLVLVMYSVSVAVGHQWARTPTVDTHEAFLTVGSTITIGERR